MLGKHPTPSWTFPQHPRIHHPTGISATASRMSACRFRDENYSVQRYLWFGPERRKMANNRHQVPLRYPQAAREIFAVPFVFHEASPNHAHRPTLSVSFAPCYCLSLYYIYIKSGLIFPVTSLVRFRQDFSAQVSYNYSNRHQLRLWLMSFAVWSASRATLAQHRLRSTQPVLALRRTAGGLDCASIIRRRSRPPERLRRDA
ncbi:hypothetical protein C8Q77DRAFT_449644 [Trametes polyzona]|nr:hypothetical protein C8Q77DRAFT_449644 [Trametes polyzona]